MTHISFRSAVAINLLSQATGLLCNVAVVLLLSRWLGAEQRGIHAIAVTTYQLGVIAFSFGASGTIASFLAGDNARLAYLRRILKIVFLVFIFCFGLLCTLIEAGAILISLTGLGLVIFLNGVGNFLRDVIFGICMARGRFYLAATVGALPPLVVLICVWMMGQDFISVSSALYIQAAGFIVGAATGIAPIIETQQGSETEETPALFGFWWKASMLGYSSSFLTLAMLRADLYLVEIYMGSRIAGVYSLAQTMAELALKVPSWAAMVLTSYVAANQSYSVAKTIKIAKYAAIIGVASSALLVVFRDLISALLIFLVGRDFGEAANIFLLMQPRVIIQAGIAIIAAHLAGQGYTIWHPLHALVGLLAVLIFSILVASERSATYIAIASSLAYLPAAIVLLFGFYRKNVNNSKDEIRRAYRNEK